VTASAEVNTGDTSQDPERFPRLYLVYGIKENGVGPIGDRNTNDETIPENAAAGTAIGFTPSAFDADYADSVTLSLIDDDARFVFTETGTTALVGTRQGATFGAVEVAEGALFDFETEPVVTLRVEASSTDGSSTITDFDIAITNVEEGGPTTPVDTDDTAESLDDTAEPGSKIGVAVRSTDPDRDPITFVSSDDRFEVDGDGNVVVSDLGKDAFDGVDEPEVIFDITAVANGISSGPLVITLPINAVRSEDVLAPVLIEPASTLPEDAAPGTFTGLIVFAEDPDPFDAIERFEVSGKFDVVPLDPDMAGRRAVVLADGAILDFEKLASEPVTITAVSTDGSTASTTFQIPVGDVNEPVGPISDSNDAPNQIPDTAGGGVDTGVQASATDPDAGATVRYFNAGDNRFTVVPEDGRVLVQSFAAFDAVAEPQVTATVEARSSDGSTTQQSFTIDVLGVNRPVGPVTDGNDAPDEIPETAGGGVDTGVQAVATDPDPGSIVRYFSVGDPRFTVVPEDGRVLVQTGASFDADSEPQVTATVEARSSDGTTSRQSFTIDVLDVNLPIANLRDASADPNFVEEDAVEGAPTGIRLALDNVDPGDTVGFTITDERFTTQPVAGRRDQFYLVVSENDDFAQFRETTIRFDVTATG
ncbi:MAG: hypothetical protein AAFR52_18715, partial [Pseudomonadota bacterium]